MRSGGLWAKAPITHVEIKNYLRKYRNLLKWKHYKESILEVGCASGRITRDVLYPHVEDHIEKLTAIDKSEEMINFAKAQYPKPNIEYRAMDIMDKEMIRSMSGQFDHIFSFYCAPWIPDQRSFLYDLYKMLKPQGQLFMTTFPSTAIKESFLRQYKEDKWWKYLPKEIIFPDYTENPVQYITNIAEDVGFIVDVCENEKKSEVIDDFEDVVRAAVSIYKYLDLLSPKLKEEYFQEHIRYSAEFSTYIGPNTYDFPYETMICICSKNMWRRILGLGILGLSGDYRDKNPSGGKKAALCFRFNISACRRSRQCFHRVNRRTAHCFKIPHQNLLDVVVGAVSIYKNLDLLSPKLKGEYFQDHIRNAAELSTYLESNTYDFPYETMLCLFQKHVK